MMRKRKKAPRNERAMKEAVLSSDSDDSTKQFGQWFRKKYRPKLGTRPKGRPSQRKNPPSPPEPKIKTSIMKTPPENNHNKNDDEECSIIHSPSSSKVASVKCIKKDPTFVTPVEATNSSSSSSSSSKKVDMKEAVQITFDLTDESDEKKLLPGARYETIREKHSLFLHMTHVELLILMKGIAVIVGAPRTIIAI